MPSSNKLMKVAAAVFGKLTSCGRASSYGKLTTSSVRASSSGKLTTPSVRAASSRKLTASSVLAASSGKLREENLNLQLLPDDILVEILSRLPAEEVFECRRVCKHWNNLTSTLFFVKKHFRNSPPSIIISYARVPVTNTPPLLRRGPEELIFMFNEWGVTLTSKNKILRTRNHACGSNIVNYYEDCGVIHINLQLASSKHYDHLYNPVTGQSVLMKTNYGHICACFYHSFSDGYRVLWYQTLSNSVTEYRILDLESQEKGDEYNWILDLVSQTDKPLWKQVANCDFAPRGVAVRSFSSNKEVLHWMTSERHNTTQQYWCKHSILMFDINKEEFSTMPHPGDPCCTVLCNGHKDMHLLELKYGVESESLLCLCDCSTKDQVDMWVLEDYHQKRIWVRRHRIVLDVAIYRSEQTHGDAVVVLPFALLKGEMFINMGLLGVFAYNISTGSLKRIIEVVNGAIGFNVEVDSEIRVALFRKSLLSFNKSKGGA